MREKPKTIDAYLAAVSRDRRQTLQGLRRAIRRVLPAAQECISYGIPAFRVDGGIVAGFAARKEGYSYYPFSGQTLSDLAGELDGHKGTKSALHFSAEQPVPAGLLRKLLDTRLAEIRRKHARPGSRSRRASGSRRSAKHAPKRSPSGRRAPGAPRHRAGVRSLPEPEGFSDAKKPLRSD